MNTEPEPSAKAVKAISFAVCTVTTAVVCANLIAYAHPNHATGKTTVKLIYLGHAPKTAHA